MLGFRNFSRNGLALALVAILPAAVAPAHAAEIGADAYAKSNNDTGLKVYQQILRAQENKANTFFSPFSLQQALGLLLNGAGGKTFELLTNVLGLKGVTLDAYNGQTRGLLDQLQKEPAPQAYGAQDFTLKVANSVWGDDSFQFAASYQKSVKTSMDAEVRNLDFGNAASADVINNWVSDKTQKKITTITDKDALASQVALLINATYFKADWTSPFNPGGTRKAPFANFKGPSASVDTMSQLGSYRYVRTGDYAAIELPYGDERKASMILVVPNDYDKFEKRLDGVTYAAVAAKLQQAKEAYGSLELPKFTFSQTIDLKKSLEAVGLASLFSAADLSRMTDEKGLMISSAIQKSFVAVNEKGTEAAAVTAIGVGRSMAPRETFAFKADKPFVFFIRDNTSGVVLFAGTVVNL